MERFPRLSRAGPSCWGSQASGRAEKIASGSVVILLEPADQPAAGLDRVLVLTPTGSVLRVSLGNLTKFPLTCKKA